MASQMLALERAGDKGKGVGTRGGAGGEPV